MDGFARVGPDEDGESDPTNLVEQAPAIVVNTPDAADEALERVEEAMETDEEDPSGELDVPALEEGSLHDAEDLLVEALGGDPHALAGAPDSFSDTASAEDVGEAPVRHGLTDRVDGGIDFPSAGGLAADVFWPRFATTRLRHRDRACHSPDCDWAWCTHGDRQVSANDTNENQQPRR